MVDFAEAPVSINIRPGSPPQLTLRGEDVGTVNEVIEACNQDTTFLENVALLSKTFGELALVEMSPSGQGAAPARPAGPQLGDPHPDGPCRKVVNGGQVCGQPVVYDEWSTKGGKEYKAYRCKVAFGHDFRRAN